MQYCQCLRLQGCNVVTIVFSPPSTLISLSLHLTLSLAHSRLPGFSLLYTIKVAMVTVAGIFFSGFPPNRISLSPSGLPKIQRNAVCRLLLHQENCWSSKRWPSLQRIGGLTKVLCRFAGISSHIWWSFLPNVSAITERGRERDQIVSCWCQWDAARQFL